MKQIVILFILFLFMGQFSISQVANNNCANAVELCPNVSEPSTNIGANITFCTGCEDDFNFCFPTNNSIWFTFTTNAIGGNVQVDFSNLVFEINPGQGLAIQATIIQATAPCSSGSYTPIGNCISNGNANFSLTATGLPANTTYYVVVDGDDSGVGITQAAECSFDVEVSGAGVSHLPPTIQVNSSNLSICKNDVVTFSVNSFNCPNIGGFNWYINSTLVAVTSDSLFSTSALSDGDIVTVETSCYTLCSEVVNVSTVPFSVYSFLVDAGPDLTISPNIATTVNGVTSAPSYSWNPNFLFSNPNSLNTIVTTDQTVTITLTATENGCTLSDDLTLTVITGLDIPNTFSPNEDGINEKWIIQGISSYPDCNVKIYTRWGQEVFFANGYSDEKAWDGTKKSGLAAEGVYFYILDLNDGSSPLIKGSLTLIR